MNQIIRCQNCGNETIQKFCANCGQNQSYTYSSKYFFVDAIQDYIGFDGKIIKTLKMLILKPGRLTADHYAGKRAIYIKPFQLFLFVNVLFLFLAVSRGSYDFTLYEFRTWTPPDVEMVKAWVNESIVDQGISYREYETKFNTNSDKIRKWLIFLLVPLFALISWIVQFKKIKYFTQHLIFSIHFFTFYWLFVTFMSPLITGLISNFVEFTDSVTIYLYPLINGLYFFFSLRRINEEVVFLSVVKSILFAVAVHYILFSYRILLFYTSYYLSN